MMKLLGIKLLKLAINTSMLTCLVLLLQNNPAFAANSYSFKSAALSERQLVQEINILEPDSAGTSTVRVRKSSPAEVKQPDTEYQKPEILSILTGELLGSTTTNENIKANYKIRILISHPKEFLEQRPQDDTHLILYAGGIALKGMTTDYFSSVPSSYIATKSKHLSETQWITFIFSRDSTTKDAWNALFKVSDWKAKSATFYLSLGWEGMFPLTYDANMKGNPRVTLIYYENWVFYLVCVLYLAFLIYFIDRCNKTGLIREPDKDKAGQYGPYSLAQTQLAFWTVVISGGFIYLTLLTGLADSLNNSCLILLGITGGTTGIAGFIDFTKKRQREAATVNQTAVIRPFVKPHVDFLTDITSDGVNISVQRTQTVLWNFILGFYFVWYVVSNKAMPVFSEALLLLAGVSSLMYLTSKGPENPQLPTPPPETPNVAKTPPVLSPAPPEQPVDPSSGTPPDIFTSNK